MSERVVTGTRRPLWTRTFDFSRLGSVRFLWTYDIHQWWIGLHWVETLHGWEVYVCLLPCLPLGLLYDDGLPF